MFETDVTLDITIFPAQEAFLVDATPINQSPNGGSRLSCLGEWVVWFSQSKPVMKTGYPTVTTTSAVTDSTGGCFGRGLWIVESGDIGRSWCVSEPNRDLPS